MDGQRFDGLTRRLSTGMSRRGALKTLGSFALAAVTARLGSRGAAANTGGCLDYGFACGIGECCSPYTCRAGTPTSICGYCLEHSAFCTYGGECCSGSCEFSLRRLWWVCQKDDHKKKKRKKKKHGNGHGDDHGNDHGHEYCSLFTEQVVLRQPGTTPVTGRQELERVERARQANYSVRHNIYQVFASGRRVAAIGRRRQLRAPYQADVHFVDVFTVADNGLLNDRTTFLFSPAFISMGANSKR